MGGDTGPTVPHTSHLFDGWVDKERHLFWVYLWLFGGSDGVPLGCRSVRLPPLDPAEEGQDLSRVVGGDTGPSVSHTSHIFDA